MNHSTRLHSSILRQLWRDVCLTPVRRASHEALSQRVPRRACLYVPGDDQRKIRKVGQVAADCVILDCEDGVAANRKARHTIKNKFAFLFFY